MAEHKKQNSAVLKQSEGAMFSESRSFGAMCVFFAAGFQQQAGGVPWWVWLLIFLVVVLIVLWAASRSRSAVRPQEPEEKIPVTATPAVQVFEGRPVKADDLTLVEGIGPKIAGMLEAEGITTFAQLASANTDHLRQILMNAGLRLADPTSWPEQARLAAEGKMEELGKLQDRLKGGRGF